jgi:hypothetical protein
MAIFELDGKNNSTYTKRKKHPVFISIISNLIYNLTAKDIHCPLAQEYK